MAVLIRLIRLTKGRQRLCWRALTPRTFVYITPTPRFPTQGESMTCYPCMLVQRQSVIPDTSIISTRIIEENLPSNALFQPRGQPANLLRRHASFRDWASSKKLRPHHSLSTTCAGYKETPTPRLEHLQQPQKPKAAYMTYGFHSIRNQSRTAKTRLPADACMRPHGSFLLLHKRKHAQARRQARAGPMAASPAECTRRQRPTGWPGWSRT